MSGIETLVKLDRISKRFGKTLALDQIDLDIHIGSIIGLLGANGSGKSTLLKHIIGLYLPDQGQCSTLGVQAKDLGPEQLSQIGYVHQEGELLDWMTVEQHIRYVSSYYNTWNHKLEETFIKDFDLPLKKRVGTLSPGVRQQLATLIAIGFEPQLLILDEPAAALDPIARAKFLDLLMDTIQDQDRTVIIASHILSDVEKIIDHVVMMEKGSMICNQPFDDLRESFFKVILTSMNGPIPERLPFENCIDLQRNESKVIFNIKNANMASLQQQADAIHCKLTTQPMSLEDIYKSMIN